MLLENYTGDSKVLKAIAHILNRKAPLPLDGGGDADFGTNGQVLTTDGSGNTSWTTPSGGGDSVSWTQVQQSGAKIAEIDINGTSQDVYAPNGGGGGGHTIWNRIKTALTARSNLWFADAKVSDISADDATKVEVLTELADETAFDNLPTDGTADGMYAFPDSGAEYLDASMVGYGSGTVADALNPNKTLITPKFGGTGLLDRNFYLTDYTTYLELHFCIDVSGASQPTLKALFDLPDFAKGKTFQYGVGIASAIGSAHGVVNAGDYICLSNAIGSASDNYFIGYYRMSLV